MFKIMLALHLLTAIFAIGPLVGAATVASRGLRTPDAGATESAARTLTIYSYASVAVVIFGMGLMSADSPYHSGKVADIGDLWIWLSIVLWAVSVAIVLAGMVPALKKAATTIREGGAVDTLVGRTAALGGITGLIYAGVVFLMVYRPGS